MCCAVHCSVLQCAVQVREKAGKVLGGMLHCSFITAEEAATLLAGFQKEVGLPYPLVPCSTALNCTVQVSSKLRRKARQGEDQTEFQVLHSTVLYNTPSIVL